MPKSGVSGAGREARQGNLFTEVSEGIHAYGIASHRHAPEIEQGLSKAAGLRMLVSFTPHLVPMNRRNSRDDVCDAAGRRHGWRPAGTSNAYLSERNFRACPA